MELLFAKIVNDFTPLLPIIFDLFKNVGQKQYFSKSLSCKKLKIQSKYHSINYAKIQVFSNPLSKIQLSYGKIRVIENSYSCIFYAVYA